MTLAAGRLNSRVEIQAPAHSPDAAAGRRTGWQRVAGVAAEVVPLAGSTMLDDGITRPVQAYRVTIRWRRGIDSRHRLIWEGQPLRINSTVDPDNRRERLVISCEAGVAT